MLELNPRHLKAFVAVARTGSIARAADTVSRVQSAITRSIQELEADLAVPLFERRPQGMRLTEFGTILLTRAEGAFAELEAARQAIAAQCADQRCNANAPIFSLGIGRQRILVFAELMKQCHMGTVAKQFGLTQSAVSLALREVEQGIGQPLVARAASGIVPNKVGELLVLHLRRALGELVKAQDEIVSRQQGITGQVIVGTLSLGRNWLLPKAIIQTTRAYPGIRISTIEGSFEHLAQLLRAAEIDFILGGLRPVPEMLGLVARPVLHSGIVLLARKDHPLREAVAGEHWGALAQARWVLPHRGTWTRTALESTLAGHKLPPAAVIVESADIVITRALVLGSELITAASPHLFQDDIASGALVVLPLASQTPARDIGMVVRATGTPTMAGRMLMQAVTALGPDGDGGLAA